MFEYLNDIDFLMALDKANLRTHYAKIVLLSFDEKPIKEIQGTISAGSLSVNGSSAVRRTINLTMDANVGNSNIEDIDNQISLNKKIYVYVGLKNDLRSYEDYGDIIWFPCGLFIVSSANITRNTSSWKITITGKDKMVLLDGTVGGMIPASTTFHESYMELENGDRQIEQFTIYKIIYEAVNHWGGEPVENIIISDLDETTKMLVKYVGEDQVFFSQDYESLSFYQPPDNPDGTNDYPHPFSYGDDAGYKETKFTYPGELILKAGDSVVTLLNKITSVLGNYEFFYDINGRFVFQQIKNYSDTGSPLNELTAEDYTKSYSNAKFLYSLTDLDTTTAVTRNPKYDNIKNDFYVWGKRKGLSDVEIPIRFHLAVDAKPNIFLADRYMWEIRDTLTTIDKDTEIEKLKAAQLKRVELIQSEPDLTDQDRDDQIIQINQYYDSLIETVENYDDSQESLIVRYEYTYNSIAPSSNAVLIGGPSTEWREELYRRALEAQVSNSVYDTYYDSELIAEWRDLYDPSKWDSTDHWNPDVEQNPEQLNFWLDFIDVGSEIGKYSINQIGRRTKVVSDDKITTIFNKDVPDVIFLEGFTQDELVRYQNIGQRFFVLTEEYYDLFQISSTGTSCYDKIKDLLYQHLSYNTTITITCLPKYYMDVNQIIYIHDEASNIDANYQITQFSLPLAYSGTMSITATEVLNRI